MVENGEIISDVLPANKDPEAGTVRLVGTSEQAIVDGVSELLTDKSTYRRMSESHNPYGDGLAAGRIVSRLLAELRQLPNFSRHAPTHVARCSSRTAAPSCSTKPPPPR